jgi:putative addiction module component (TIGR02574 family)
VTDDVRCGSCGGELVTTTADLPFQIYGTDTVTQISLLVRACDTCPEVVIDDAVMTEIDDILSHADQEAPITDAQTEELDRRLDALEREGPGGLSWDEMEAKAHNRKR